MVIKIINAPSKYSFLDYRITKDKLQIKWMEDINLTNITNWPFGKDQILNKLNVWKNTNLLKITTIKIPKNKKIKNKTRAIEIARSRFPSVANTKLKKFTYSIE